MNTVGKPGKLGEHIRCVVSVSMLTEGWDANTVTHILGVRAFGTQLLCEQVVGRGLRRMSYAVNEQERFEPEYAEVYGVPFSFIPARPRRQTPEPGAEADARPRARRARRRSRSPSRASPAIATTSATERLTRGVQRRVEARAVHRRRPDEDRGRADRRRIAASTRSTTCQAAPAKRLPSGWPS